MTDTANSRMALFTAIQANPRDLWAWCCLRDILEAEGEDDEVLKVCDQAGTWIGSREDWEREGPVVVDVVPVVRVWVLDMAPSLNDISGHWWYLIGIDSMERINHPSPDDVAPLWHNRPVGDSEFMYCNSPEEAQSALTQIALEYARRVRDGKEEAP